MFEIAYQIINKKGEIITKTKTFDSEAKMDKWYAKASQKDNFYRVLAYR